MRLRCSRICAVSTTMPVARWPLCQPPMRAGSRSFSGGARSWTGRVSQRHGQRPAGQRSRPSVRTDDGIAALRQRLVPAAIEQLEAAVAAAADSSRDRGARDRVFDRGRRREEPSAPARCRAPESRDERSWLALARTLNEVGRTAEAADVLRQAVDEVSDVTALRWRLSTSSKNLQHADSHDLLATADRFVLFVGKGELIVPWPGSRLHGGR